MAGKNDSQRFTLKNVFSYLAVSAASHWKPMLVAAPLIGTALFLASGTQAQTSGNAAPTAPTSASGPVAPIETAAAARRKGPKVKVKEAMDTSRVANPPATTDPVTPAQTGASVAPIDAPEAARRKGPKIKVKEISTRVEEPAPATEPVAQPTERRRKGPKERDDDVSTRTGRPKERDPTPMDTSRTGRPKEGDDSPHSRTSLLLPVLGGAAAIAAIVAGASGGGKPASP
jgi:hypothetical protein